MRTWKKVALGTYVVGAVATGLGVYADNYVKGRRRKQQITDAVAIGIIWPAAVVNAVADSALEAIGMP